MKTYRIFIELPDLPAAHAQHEITVRASALHVATARALAAVAQKPQVKGCRIFRAKIAVYIGEPIHGG